MGSSNRGFPFAIPRWTPNHRRPMAGSRVSSKCVALHSVPARGKVGILLPGSLSPTRRPPTRSPAHCPVRGAEPSPPATHTQLTNGYWRGGDHNDLREVSVGDVNTKARVIANGTVMAASESTYAKPQSQQQVNLRKMRDRSVQSPAMKRWMSAFVPSLCYESVS
jgi:hypothetical protein